MERPCFSPHAILYKFNSVQTNYAFLCLLLVAFTFIYQTLTVATKFKYAERYQF